jgi:adenylate kinase
MQIYIFVGPPGSGKGTMASMLQENNDFLHLSTGDILRKEMAEGTELGKQASEYVNKGDLIPDDLISDVVENRLSETDPNISIILDGFPRTTPQAELLADAIKRVSADLEAIVLFEVDEDALIKRITGRRLCKNCGAMFNVFYNPPAEDNTCDHCKGELSQRKDDTEETARNRFEVYKKQTMPLLDFYADSANLINLDASQELDEVYKSLRKALSL